MIASNSSLFTFKCDRCHKSHFKCNCDAIYNAAIKEKRKAQKKITINKICYIHIDDWRLYNDGKISFWEFAERSHMGKLTDKHIEFALSMSAEDV